MTDAEIIATYKREGLWLALKRGAVLLNSEDGLVKHGPQGWREHDEPEIRAKRVRHLSQIGTEDENSGMDHGWHALIRLLQELVLRGEKL